MRWNDVKVWDGVGWGGVGWGEVRVEDEEVGWHTMVAYMLNMEHRLQQV